MACILGQGFRQGTNLLPIVPGQLYYDCSITQVGSSLSQHNQTAFCQGYRCSIKGRFHFNTLRPRQNGRHFADDTFKRIFLIENVRISIEISLKLVPKGPINNISALVQVMAWCRPGDKPLSEPLMVRLPTHIRSLGLNDLTLLLSISFHETYKNTFVFSVSRY